MKQPKSMHTRGHIAVGGYGDETGDWVQTLCGRAIPLKDCEMSWVPIDVGAHCNTCLKKWAERE